MDDVLDPLDSFKTFNEFFYRKLKPSARPICSLNKKVACCPADARTNCFPTISLATQLWIKGSKFTLKALLGDASMV